MNPIDSCITALAIAVIFYIYRGYRHLLSRRQRVLRERVAYMLWVVAEKAERAKRMAIN